VIGTSLNIPGPASWGAVATTAAVAVGSFVFAERFEFRTTTLNTDAPEHLGPRAGEPPPTEWIPAGATEGMPVRDEDTLTGWERCLSIPGLHGKVSRPSALTMTYQDLSGEEITLDAKGALATLLQHECDHLDGVLYPQRIEDMRQFGFLDTLSEKGVIELQPCDDDP
jgi:hypothetical protein